MCDVYLYLYYYCSMSTQRKIMVGLTAVVVLGLAVVFSVFLARNKTEVKITYVVNEEVVKTKKVIKGNQLGYTYVYENPNHQSYATTWKDENGKIYNKNTIVNKSVTLNGDSLNTVITFTTEENEYTYVNGLNYVCSDGIVVIDPIYKGKEICLGIGAISNNKKIKELYLPDTLHHIYDDNFSNCSKLKTIYYEGSEEEWNAIPTSSAIPDNITIVFDTSFVY